MKENKIFNNLCKNLSNSIGVSKYHIFEAFILNTYL